MLQLVSVIFVAVLGEISIFSYLQCWGWVSQPNVVMISSACSDAGVGSSITLHPHLKHGPCAHSW